MLVTSRPRSSALCPPLTSSRPSGINAWPEQNSIVSTLIICAVLGGPAAGSHSRGIAIVPSSSNLPQASTFPVGNRLACSGTMAQSTLGSHLPVVASGGSALMLIEREVLETVPVVNRSVCAPGPAMPRSTKAAVPLVLVVAVTVPCRVPDPVAMLAVTTTPGTTTPPASFTSTIGWSVGAQTSESSALVGGCRLMVRVAGAPAVARLGDVSSGRVTLSPLQVSDAAASVSVRAMRTTDPVRCIGPGDRETALPVQDPSHQPSAHPRPNWASLNGFR